MSDVLVNFLGGGSKKKGDEEDEDRGRSRERSREYSKSKSKSTEDKPIIIPFKYKDVQEDLVVIPFKKSAVSIMHRSIIFYGPSGSGKTTVLKNFLYLTRKYFPIVIAFAPTNPENHAYDGIVPKALIHETGWGLPEIQDVYDRQKSAAGVYSVANNLKTLDKLFMRVANDKAIRLIEKIFALKTEHLTKSRI